jgi:hypothetical protein
VNTRNFVALLYANCLVSVYVRIYIQKYIYIVCVHSEIVYVNLVSTHNESTSTYVSLEAAIRSMELPGMKVCVVGAKPTADIDKVKCYTTISSTFVVLGEDAAVLEECVAGAKKTATNSSSSFTSSSSSSAKFKFLDFGEDVVECKERESIAFDSSEVVLGLTKTTLTVPTLLAFWKQQNAFIPWGLITKKTSNFPSDEKACNAILDELDEAGIKSVYISSIGKLNIVTKLFTGK